MSAKYLPLYQLILTRFREFLREREAIFWVYGFPLILTVALGIAFRNQPITKITVDIEVGPHAEKVLAALEQAQRPQELEFDVFVADIALCRQRLRTAKTDVIVSIDDDGQKVAYRYSYDNTRNESRISRTIVNDSLQEANGRRDVVETLPDAAVQAPGSRYIDFLIPGLLGMSVMGGGLWGVGYVIVDMRIRKLLKRLLATPMKTSHLLAAIMISRFCFLVPEVLTILLFARLFFGVTPHGNLGSVILLIVLGSFTFQGIGLLVGSRAKTLESVSGLMNLVMLPMYILSGIFFSSDRFPEAVRPIIKLLPLTPLIDSLRAVMLEGAGLGNLLFEILTLTTWGVASFLLALKIFRWR